MKKIFHLLPTLLLLPLLLGTACTKDIGESGQDLPPVIVTEENTPAVTVGSNAELPDAEYPSFDFEKKTVTLSSGYEMPILGLGMFSLSDTQAENSTYWALKAGFRLIDTARIYGNETGVGRGLQRAIDEGIVTREEVFITTKMWTSDYNRGDEAVDASLERLGVDYIDLMILHHSQPENDVEAYRAMERAVEEGKLRSIGLSNYVTSAQLIDGPRIPKQSLIQFLASDRAFDIRIKSEIHIDLLHIWEKASDA